MEHDLVRALLVPRLAAPRPRGLALSEPWPGTTEDAAAAWTAVVAEAESIYAVSCGVVLFLAGAKLTGGTSSIHSVMEMESRPWQAVRGFCGR